MSDAAALMDHMYRRQRHIYDLSRKFYLLGRDEAIARLRPASGDKVLEIGCGTGRNLIKLAQAYPQAQLFGLDVSQEMLTTAGVSAARAGFASRIVLAQAALLGVRDACVKRSILASEDIHDPFSAREIDGYSLHDAAWGRLADSFDVGDPERFC